MNAWRPILTCFKISLLFLSFTINADSDTLNADIYADSSAESVSNPMPGQVTILIHTKNNEWVCPLGRMEPPQDSCADVSVEFPQPTHTVSIKFHFGSARIWKYDGIESDQAPDDTAKTLRLRVECTYEDSTNLRNASIFNMSSIDSASRQLPISAPKEIAEISDTLSSPDFSIRRSVYPCNDYRFKEVVEMRVFTYPPGYGHRGQRLNYPDIAMFHYGKSVRMPTARSLQKRADAIIVYKTSATEPLVYDDPDEIYAQEAAINRLRRLPNPAKQRKPENRRPPAIRFRPIGSN